MKHFHLKLLGFFVFTLLFTTELFSQNIENLWSKTDQIHLNKDIKLQRKSTPNKASYFKLNIEQLKILLNNTPKRSNHSKTSNTIISFPNSDGKLDFFRIKEASILHPDLQSQLSNSKSYIGQNLNDPSSTIRFSITSQGLHAMIFSSKNGLQFIDPTTKNGNNYIVYKRKDLPISKEEFICNVTDEIPVKDNVSQMARNANDGKLRTFRIAIATTIEYSQFHWTAAGLTAGDTEEAKKDAVLDAIIVTMTRVNGLFERDLSVTMELVANNKDIIFIDSDNFSNNASGDLINESQTEIDNIIGNANYDIGHTFSTGGGGLATLAVPCVTGSKARGITGLSSPVGDPFDVDFVAHEIGHQFGAPHTFNGDTGSCAAQRTASNAYEPGSGSTIMAYAGICSPQNVQNNSDAYFHQKSLQMMWDNISAGNSTCAAQTDTGNNAPTAEAGANYTIPISTPYKLTGSSTDADGTGTHTYTWEQYDLGPAGIPTETTVDGPLVRSFEGTNNPTRYIPELTSILANGGVSTTWEKLVSINREINFQLTVRDNDMRGGQIARDNMVINTDDSAGPFIVTSQTTNETWGVGTIQTVTWDVANTNIGNVNTPTVNILLSIDGGLTYPFVLASDVPNDGSHNVNIPAVGGDNNTARVMVEGHNNIFFAINSTNFSIQESEFALTASNATVNVCKPSDAVVNFTYNTFLGFTGNTVFSANDLPSGASAVFSPSSATADGTSVTATISGISSLTEGNYPFSIVGTSGSIVKSSEIDLNVFSSTFNTINLTFPSNEAIDVLAHDTELTWEASVNAQNYLVEIASDSGFTSIIESSSVNTNRYSPTSLANSTQYFWRVTPSNLCGSGNPSTTNSFTTASISCASFNSSDTPIDIPDNDSTGISSILGVPSTDGLSITDVNVTLNITHPWIGDLTVTLISPNGTQVRLVNSRNDDGDNYTSTVFDDGATNTISGSVAPYTGTFLPEAALSKFNGEMSNGDWTLVITDTGPADLGSLDSWVLEICGTVPPDTDGDGATDNIDNCVNTANADQADFDGDNIGDICDPDIDNDGVLNDNDQCDNTPLGEAVDINGCTVFALPANNFTLNINSETCRNSNNGSIFISTIESHNYTAQLTGNGIDTSNTFTSSTEFNNLEAGNYTVCITVDGEPDYEICFNVTITEPEDLSVISTVNSSRSSVTLELSGSSSIYYIELNGVISTTTNSEITLDLDSGVNQLKVTTDKDCQGEYKKTINNAKVIVYPNPINNNSKLFIAVNDSNINTVEISLHTVLGQRVLYKNSPINNGKVSIDISNLSKGMYLMSLSIGQEQLNYKIIKK